MSCRCCAAMEAVRSFGRATGSFSRRRVGCCRAPAGSVHGDPDDATTLASPSRCSPLDIHRTDRASANQRRGPRARASPRQREPALGLSADRWRDQRSGPSSVGDDRQGDPARGWHRPCREALGHLVAGVSAGAGAEHARRRLLHRGDGLAAAPLHIVLHRAGQPSRLRGRLHR